MEIDFSKLPDQGSTGIDWAKLPDPGEKTTITQDIAGAISKGMEAISPAVVPFLAAGQVATQAVDWGIDKLFGRKEQEIRPEVEDMSLANEIIRREGLGRNIPEYLIHVARKIAIIEECSLDKVAAVTTANAQRIFGKK